jgi:hypothetical protein
LEKAGAERSSHIAQTANISDIFEVSNGKCRKEKKEENKQTQVQEAFEV